MALDKNAKAITKEKAPTRKPTTIPWGNPEIVQRAVAELIPYARNARTHSEEQITKIAASIKEFGFTNPILTDGESGVIAGHGRLMAAKKLALDTVPCIELSHLTKTQKKAYILADNRLAEDASGAGWDMDMVSMELDELELDGFNIDLTGFEKNDVQVEAQEDDFEVDLGIGCSHISLGDIFTFSKDGQELHRLMCGDSIKAEDVEKMMNGKRADMVFTDPPYNVDYTGKTKDALKVKNDKMSDDDFRQFISDFFSLTISNMKRGGACYICIPLEVGVIDTLMSMMHLQSVLIWVKNVLVLWRQDYQEKKEPILFFADETYEKETEGIIYGWKEGDSHEWYWWRKQTSVWEFDRPSSSKDHPTMKPVLLVAKGIQNSSKQGYIVVDPFLGSWSTMVACHQLNRKCYGMELDPKYCAVIIERMQKLDLDLKVEHNGKPYAGATASESQDI